MKNDDIIKCLQEFPGHFDELAYNNWLNKRDSLLKELTDLPKLIGKGEDEPLTVADLIRVLQTMPQDALAITTYCSDYEEITLKHISLCQPSDYEKTGTAIINHNGHIMDFRDKWKDGDSKPNFITAVYFAGN